METTSTIVNSMKKSSGHVSDDAPSDKDLTRPAEGVHVQRDFDVVSNAKNSHEMV